MTSRLNILLLVILLHVPPHEARAVPAHAPARTVVLGSGRVLTLHLAGDEHQHAWLDSDGTPYLQHPDGTWTAANADSLRQRWNRAAGAANARRRERRRAHFGDPTAYTGRKRGLVLLIQFPDLSMSAAGTQAEFHDMFNRPGYDHYGHAGSVRDYFSDQSYGALTIDFDVVGPLTVSRQMAYYGGNGGLGGSDRHVRQMVAEACRLADGQVNFADYDWDADGTVDQVYCIYAGYGENAGAPAYTIWPHESNLGTDDAWGGGYLTLDATVIDTYACSCELAGTHGTTLNGIGTACHEFSHCLGLPDFYDISYTGGPGMGCWDLMDSGSYAGPEGNGEVPYGFSAYERWFAGWLTFTDITHSQRIPPMPDLATAPVAYTMRNPICHDEYLILENHQPSRWYAWAATTPACHGLMLTHVDYDPDRWHNNRVNNNNRHQCMSIVPADGSHGTLSAGRYHTDDTERRGDLFPGASAAGAVTRTSHTDVGACLYQPQPNAPTPLTLVLNDITETGGRITLDVINPDSICPPSDLQATQQPDGTIIATWTPEPTADTYDIEITRVASTKPYRTTTEVIQAAVPEASPSGPPAAVPEASPSGPLAAVPEASPSGPTSATIPAASQRAVCLRIRAVVGGLPSLWSDYAAIHTDAIHDDAMPDVAVPEAFPSGPNPAATNAPTTITTLAGTAPHPANPRGIIIVRQGSTTRKLATRRH